MSKKVKASIVILDYLKSKRVVENVKSILGQKTDFPFEIVVVDNSDNPENAKKLAPLKHLQNVKLIINEKNVGYIRGNNQAVKRTKGEYILIVNPDIIWSDPNTLQKLVDHMDSHPEIGIMGPKQINDDTGKVAMTVRRFPKLSLQIARRTKARHWPILKRLVRADECRDLDYDQIQTVDWLQSSFWITRRKLWDQWGGLSTDYFIFMSDPALCWKCWKSRYKVVYNPSITVRADGRRASEGGIADFFEKPLMKVHLKESIKYRIKHLGRRNPRRKLLRKSN